MHNVDFLIVGIYLIVMFVIGLLMKGKAGQSITSYFVADRSLPGWWVGLSILATTFAADTPLAVTGLTAQTEVFKPIGFGGVGSLPTYRSGRNYG